MAFEIPLFPLNVVLFPGMELPLHIFEPRYRLMIAECLEMEQPFGVVLVHPESEHLREETYSIGTVAEIQATDTLEDGRINILTKGTQRFRILSSHREKPYLSGMVEPFTDLAESAKSLTFYARQARELFNTYLEIVLEVVGKPEVQVALPSIPEDLSHLIAYFLDIQDEQKQHFLELTSTRQRLQEEIATLRREVPFMRQVLSMSNRFGTHAPDRSILN